MIEEPKHRSDLRLKLGRFYYGTLHKLWWIKMHRVFARSFQKEPLPYRYFSHKTILLRRLKDVDMWMQENKIKNLMELIYKKATLDDLETLTETRVQVLRAANKLSEDVDMSEVKEKSCEYYKEALRDGTHVAYLVFDGDEFVGAGGVSFFKVMPTFHNPSGEKAYIMNMYTKPEYRRGGIAFQTLDLLVAEARKKGVTAISLEATDMGRPLYEKYGFVKMNDEMELPGA